MVFLFFVLSTILGVYLALRNLGYLLVKYDAPEDRAYYIIIKVVSDMLICLVLLIFLKDLHFWWALAMIIKYSMYAGMNFEETLNYKHVS